MQPTEKLRRHQDHMNESFREHRRAVLEDPGANLVGLLNYLDEELFPFLSAGEAVLFGELDRQTESALTTAGPRETLTVLETRAGTLGELRQEEPLPGGEVRRLLHEFSALLDLHFQVLDEVFLPVLDHYLNEEEFNQALDDLFRRADEGPEPGR